MYINSVFSCIFALVNYCWFSVIENTYIEMETSKKYRQ